MNISKKAMLALAFIGSEQIFCSESTSNDYANLANTLTSKAKMFSKAQDIFNTTKNSKVAQNALSAMNSAKEEMTAVIMKIAENPETLSDYVPQTRADAAKLAGRAGGAYLGYKAGSAVGSTVGKTTGTAVGAVGGGLAGGYAGYQLTQDDKDLNNRIAATGIGAAAGTVVGGGVGNVAGDIAGSTIGSGIGAYAGYKGGEALADYLINLYLNQQQSQG